MTRILLGCLLALMSQVPALSENYSAVRTTADGVAIVRLTDAAHHAEVSIAPAVGNMAYEFKINGKNALWFPYAKVSDFAAAPQFCGIPFLAPWANRLDQYAFYANGQKFILNPDLKNIRPDSNHFPIHGLLMFSSYWEVVEAKAGAASAHVTSRLDFWKHPDLMAQFPFAHSIEMTYRLSAGVLEVETVLRNLSADPMPVSLGFHPYFTLHDAPRDAWTVHLAARDHVELSPKLVPTGQSKPVEFADPYPLKGAQLDDVFSNLIRGSDGRADFWVQGDKERITVSYGPKYPVAVSFAPPGRNFICFEPMAAVTNALNLARSGQYKDLRSVAPGGEWRESFWIRPTGF